MRKLVFIASVVSVGYAVLLKGGFLAPPPPQEMVVTEPLADRAARLAAEQERIYAEQAAVARNWQPRQFSERGAAVSTLDANCATARHNVNVTGNWMRKGGAVYEEGTNKRYNENESFDAAARNRQYIEDNCRGR
jgi:hypothetical protein